MTINYLKSFNQNKLGLKLSKIADPKGLTIERIQEIEQIINNGNPLPKAFKEFLFIGGEYAGLGISPIYDCDNGNGIEFIESKKVYEDLIKKEGLSINRPYIVINSGDDSNFDFIYLDEGDNPQPRFLELDERVRTIENGKYIFDHPEKTFSEFIDRLVDFALKGLMPF